MNLGSIIRPPAMPKGTANLAGRAVLTAAVALSAGLVTVVGVASPAAAAPALDCTGALYLTDNSTAGGRVLRLGLDGSLGTTSIYDPTTGDTTDANQLGI